LPSASTSCDNHTDNFRAASETVQLVYGKFRELQGHDQQGPEMLRVAARGLDQHIIGEVCQFSGRRPILYQRAMEWDRKNLHVDIKSGHLFQSALDIDHAAITVHPADHPHCVLPDRRVVIAEDSLKASNVGG
jgi:hypothetical protein